MRATAAYLSLSLLLGVISVWASENLFWSAPPSDLDLPGLLLTILAYALCCAAVLTVVLINRNQGLVALIGGGALLGWCVEGIIVGTAYEAFPAQMVWTPLAWHMLISGLIVFGLCRAGPHWPLGRQIAAWTGVGILMGLWALYWPTERSTLPPMTEVGFYLIGGGILSVLANMAIDRIGPAMNTPPVWVMWVATGLLAALWVVQRIAVPDPVTLALPFVIWLTVWAMGRLGSAGPLEWRPAPSPWRHAVLLVAPVIATPIAVKGWAIFGEGVGVNVPFALVSGLLGLWLWGWLIWKAIRAPASAPP
jgi:hypothetical protein